MSDRRRERLFLGISGLALLGALVAGIAMLLRARTVWQDESAARDRVELVGRRDALRGSIAEITCLRRLASVPAQHALSADLRSALRDAARAFQDDPLEGNDLAGVFACVAIEVGGGDDGLAVWTSGPIAAEDRSWCLGTISAGTTDRGSEHSVEPSRVIGVAWSAFEVDGEPRIGALAWLTPRSR